VKTRTQRPLSAIWCCSSWLIAGLPIRFPFALALAIPAFVRSLIFCASSLANEGQKLPPLSRPGRSVGVLGVQG
jgi:hypothetical protein